MDSEKQYTISLIFSSLYNEYEKKIWKSVINSGKKYNHNILCYMGGNINSNDYNETQKSSVYELINSDIVDGYILASVCISNYASYDDLKKFSERFYPKPIVSIGVELKEHSYVCINNETGMKELMEHLIKDHKYKRIACARGPENNFDANTRFNVYKESLLEHNIPFDEKLIFPCSFSINFDVNPIVNYIYRHINEIDALVVATDNLAILIIKKLQEMGIAVPEQIAVTGFDNTNESKSISPDLTTVNQPVEKLGQIAYQTLFDIIREKETSHKIMLQSTLVKRRSCGCSSFKDRYGIDLKLNNKIVLDDSAKPTKKTLKEILKKEMIATFQDYENRNIFNSFSNELIDALMINNEELSINDFALKFEEIIEKSPKLGIKFHSWYELIYNFMNIIKKKLKFKNNETFYKQILELFILIGSISEKYQFEINNNTQDIVFKFFIIIESLILTFSMKQLDDVFKHRLKLTGINSCYIIQYVNNKKKDKAKLLFAYDTKNEIKDIKNNTFLTKDLLPDNIKLFKTRKACLITSLFHKENTIGYMIIEVGPLFGEIYEYLNIQMSAAIHSAQLMEEIQKYSTNLEDKIKERTKRLKIANEKLKQLDKLKNDFIANITHDFRSPLTVIQNISDLALITNPDEKETRDNFELINTASIKLNRTINQLLDLAKMDEKGIKLKVSKVDLYQYFTEITNYYQSSLSSTGIQIFIDIPDQHIDNFYIDLEKMEGVINNIISNAVKFVDPENGIIRIKIEKIKKVIRISIIDNGIGIPKEKIKTIFDRFFQVEDGRKSGYGGTGIGLAFSKQLVEFMMGKIWCESDGKNKGARFIIEFKTGKSHFSKNDFIKDKPAKINIDHINTLVKLNIQGHKLTSGLTKELNNINQKDEFNYKKGIILLIDDDKNITNIVMKYLANQGYLNFIIANNGKSGLEAIYTYSPDLIICDYNMPDIRGDQIHDEIINNSELEKIPFIFLSAVADKELILRRKEKGVSAYLKKPIEKKDLIFTVEYHMKIYYEYLKTHNIAVKDDLTGIYNRKEIINILYNIFSKSEIKDIAIVFFDIDNFKKYNDKYGHQLGDEILKSIGSILNKNLRQDDVVGRYGGDEFIILLSNVDDEKAEKAVKYIQEKINNSKLEYQGNSISYTCSYGIISLKSNKRYIEKQLKIDDLFNSFNSKKNQSENNHNIIIDKTINLLINSADKALYEAKFSVCHKCGFKSINEKDFKNKVCPNCNSKSIDFGRNKIIIFKE